mmetsp:Transcript_91946/g.259759  ORF Transcript_91946/g.259759 Transcript_91946/m.259759 type:complete len:240 (+) Transcript_91946:104-823(+)
MSCSGDERPASPLYPAAPALRPQAEPPPRPSPTVACSVPRQPVTSWMRGSSAANSSDSLPGRHPAASCTPCRLSASTEPWTSITPSPTLISTCGPPAACPSESASSSLLSEDDDPEAHSDVSVAPFDGSRTCSSGPPEVGNGMISGSQATAVFGMAEPRATRRNASATEAVWLASTGPMQGFLLGRPTARDATAGETSRNSGRSGSRSKRSALEVGPAHRLTGGLGATAAASELTMAAP